MTEDEKGFLGEKKSIIQATIHTTAIHKHIKYEFLITKDFYFFFFPLCLKHPSHPLPIWTARGGRFLPAVLAAG